jgi:hypothetical protein
MSLFGRNPNDNSKHTGVMISPHAHSFLALYCLANKTSISEFIRKMVESWIIKERASESDIKLVEKVIQRTLCIIKRDNAIPNRQRPFDETIKLIKIDLRRKGISEENINLIIKGIEEANGKNNK